MTRNNNNILGIYAQVPAIGFKLMTERRDAPNQKCTTGVALCQYWLIPVQWRTTGSQTLSQCWHQYYHISGDDKVLPVLFVCSVLSYCLNLLALRRNPTSNVSSTTINTGCEHCYNISNGARNIPVQV